MEKIKRLDIELMRIIAVFFVIFNHTGKTGFFFFSLYDVHSMQYWIYLFISIFCKLSVPLFFMISGALMLNRQGESIKRIWVHRVFHISVVLGIWSFFYYLAAVKHGNYQWLSFFSRLYDSNWNFSYWYLYVYIAFLISLPLLQRFAQSLTDKEYMYMFFVYIVFAMVIPSAQYLLFQGRHVLNGNLSIGWLMSSIVIFPLTGYFLSFRKKDFWNEKRIMILWMINIATILLSSYLTYYRARIMGVCDEGHSQAFHSTFVLINCVAVFVTCQYLNEHSTFLEKLAKPVTSLGGCTFGIYLLHVYIMKRSILNDFLWNTVQANIHMSPMLYAFVLCGVILLCCYIITLAFKQIPILSRLVS